MNREDIIRMAREAGIFETRYNPVVCSATPEALEHFAALVAAAERKRVRSAMKKAHLRMSAYLVAAEREACAKACEDYWQIDGTDTALAFAATVRARGQA